MAQATTNDVRDLAQIVALLADATAKYIDGSMSKDDAAANIRNMNSQAGGIMRRLG